MRPFVLFLVLAGPAWAASHAPLPKPLIEAKTGYVLNESWHTSTGDRCVDDLSKWGRFKLLGEKKDADLVFHLTGSIEDLTTLTVVDQHTGEILWTGKPDKPRKVVRELRERVENGKQAPK